MGKLRFRFLTGLVVLANLLAMSPVGGLAGFFAIWALLIVIAPFMIAATVLFSATARAPEWIAAAVVGAVGLSIVALAVRRLVRANAERLLGDHDAARRSAFSAFWLASIPSCLVLSVLSLERQWPT